MGNCVIGKQHELLNEYSDRYFDRVQARNSVHETRRPWFCPFYMVATLEGQNDDEKKSMEPVHTVSTEVPSSSQSSPTSEEEPLLLFPSLWTPSSPKPYNALDATSKDFASTSPSAFTKFYVDELRIQTDGATDGWQVKRKGHALKLRLAKNRFLQLAATQPLLSPITLDSDIIDFETNGMVWVEITRPVPVTALAMSRSQTTCTHIGTSSLPASTTCPLLMAVGDAAGIVTVTEIVDNVRTKFGETLEFPMEGRIRSMDFSPDTQYLIVGGDGCVAAILLIVLDPITNQLRDLRILQQVERLDRIYSVQFHPSGTQISIAGFDGKVAIGSVDTVLSGDPVMKEIARPGLIYCMDWNPLGEQFAVGGSDKMCVIYKKDGTLVHETSRATSIQALQWNHNGTLLAMADKEVAILDANSFHIKCEISNAPDEYSPSNSKYRIESLCWSPDGSFLAIGGSDGICLVVETKGYALVHEVHRTSRILSLSWGQRVSRNDYGRYLAISEEGCTVALVKAGVEPEGSEVDEASSAASSSHFSTASDWVLREDCFRDIDETPDETLEDIKPQGNITAVAFSRCSKSKGSSYLAYAADDCSLTIMTTRDWKAVFQMEFAKPLRTLVFSHSNNFLALGGDESVLYVLSVPSRSIIYNTIFNAAITTVAFSRKDERLAVGTKDGVLSLLCPDADWEPVGELDYSESPILAQAWCSKTMAVGREDGSVAIFDTEKAFCNFFVPLAEFSHAKPIRSLAFGTSGRFLAAGGDCGVLSILSSKGGWVLCNQFKVCAKSNVLATKWSPAGRYLLLAGSQKFCRVIDTISWTDVTDVQKATTRIFQEGSTTNAISSIDWSVDGNWAALGTVGGGIYVIGTNGWHLLVPSKDRLTLSSEASDVG